MRHIEAYIAAATIALMPTVEAKAQDAKIEPVDFAEEKLSPEDLQELREYFGDVVRSEASPEYDPLTPLADSHKTNPDERSTPLLPQSTSRFFDPCLTPIIPRVRARGDSTEEFAQYRISLTPGSV